MRYDVRPLTAPEVPVVEAAMPTRGMDVHRVWQERMAGGTVTYLVAWAGVEPVGTGLVRWGEQGAEPGSLTHPAISNLWVAVPWRGRGSGTAIVRAAEALIAVRGYSGASMGVAVDNLDAQRLYRRLDYREIGEETTTTYDWVDEAGVSQRITETDRELRRDF